MIKCTICLPFKEVAKQCFEVVVPFYFPTSSVGELVLIAAISVGIYSGVVSHFGFNMQFPQD